MRSRTILKTGVDPLQLGNSSRTLPIAPPGASPKGQQSRDAQKVLRLLAKKLRFLGFERTKPTFFTRPSRYVLEFVHVHKYSFGPSLRVHFGIRVRSDDAPAAHLNGPSSDAIPDPAVPGRRLYSFAFDASEGGQLSCAEAMYRCVALHGLAWFESMAEPLNLLAVDSPLHQDAGAALQQELSNPSMTKVSDATQRVLNAATGPYERPLREA